MASQIDLEISRLGVPFKGAYFRMLTAAVARHGDGFFVLLDVVGYAVKPIEPDATYIDYRRYRVPIIEVEAQKGDTFLAKCYEWVMQQPDMQGSVGV